jgi:hypothetical protein
MDQYALTRACFARRVTSMISVQRAAPSWSCQSQDASLSRYWSHAVLWLRRKCLSNVGVFVEFSPAILGLRPEIQYHEFTETLVVKWFRGESFRAAETLVRVSVRMYQESFRSTGFLYVSYLYLLLKFTCVSAYT